MQNNKFSDIKDEIGEMAIETVKVVKKQITQKPADQTQDQTRSLDAAPFDPAQGKRDMKDPVTGKPIPSKKLLTHLTQQTAQLAQMRLKKVREELEKQRLRIGESVKGKGESVGPEIKQEDKKPKDDAVAKTLAASKSTGEFKGLVGG